VEICSTLACDAAEAAEGAAEELDDWDGAIAGDDTEHYIEVEGGGRFAVDSESVRKYRANPF
jgi:hypothetical protein